ASVFLPSPPLRGRGEKEGTPPTRLFLETSTSRTMSAPTGQFLAHNAYFALHDPSEAARNRLLAACRQYLAVHPGVVFFACGVLADALNREVNDRDFDVGLHIVFTDQAAHDAYQVSATHHQFVDENKASWRRV